MRSWYVESIFKILKNNIASTSLSFCKKKPELLIKNCYVKNTLLLQLCCTESKTGYEQFLILLDIEKELH